MTTPQNSQRQESTPTDAHLPDVVDIPEGWVITWELSALRSQEPVHVIRWEPEGPRTLGGEQVSVVLSRSDDRLISYRHAYLPPDIVAQIRGGETPIPSERKAAHIAEATMRSIDPRDAARSLPMRVEHEMREWVASDGSMLEIPVLWHKYAAPGGGFSWVSVGPGGQVIEYERDSQWDFQNWRRESEQWDHDGWIAAREGTGTQLAPPAALA